MSGLLGRWGLNEGSGTTVADSSGQSVTGTLVGTPGRCRRLRPEWQRADPPTLVSPADGAVGVSTSPDLSVAASDPDGGNLDVTFYGRPSPSATEDFTLVALPDTQNYSATYPSTFTAQTQWIVDQQGSDNIVFVSHLGDITDGGDATPLEWDTADTAMSLLDGHVPYAFAPGNHDKVGGTAVQYNAHFGVSRYSGLSWYGGHYWLRQPQQLRAVRGIGHAVPDPASRGGAVERRPGLGAGCCFRQPGPPGHRLDA